MHTSTRNMTQKQNSSSTCYLVDIAISTTDTTDSLTEQFGLFCSNPRSHVG